MAIDIYRYWSDKPPEPSPKLDAWLERIKNGWQPNRRVRQMGYEEAAEFFGVYIWEYFNVIKPAIYVNGPAIEPKCGATFELANGEIVTPCHLPVGHEGDHHGTVLGSGCSWGQGYETEEEQYFERKSSDNKTS